MGDTRKYGWKDLSSLKSYDKKQAPKNENLFFLRIIFTCTYS